MSADRGDETTRAGGTSRVRGRPGAEGRGATEGTEAVLVTGVRSRTHLVYVASYLRTLPPATSVHYLEGGGFLSATVNRSDVQRFLPGSVQFLSGMGEFTASGPVTYVAVGAPGLRPWSALRRAEPRRRITTVVVDEGLGTYGDRRTRRAAYLRQGGRPLRSTVRAAAITAGDRVLTSLRWPLYRKEADWAVAGPVRAEFLRALGPVDRSAYPPDRAILLTQPWIDLGLVDPAAYHEHVAAIAARQQAEGREFVVRPHPAEPEGRYDDYPTMVATVPAELDPAVVTAGLLIGASSTALLNLAALHDVPVLRVLPPGTEALETALGRDQRALLARYLPPAVGGFV